MTTQPQLNPTLSELTTTPKDYELDSHKEVITNAVNTRKNTVSMASTRNDSMESTQRNYSFIKYYTICSVYCMYEDPRNSPEGRMGLLVLPIVRWVMGIWREPTHHPKSQVSQRYWDTLYKWHVFARYGACSAHCTLPIIIDFFSGNARHPYEIFTN